MTEAEWLVCTDPKAVLRNTPAPPSERKLRLFACALCRQLWERFTDARCRDAVLTAERYADGTATEQELAKAR
jgi:hypothetical protein